MRSLAIVLCLCLLAPALKAATGTDRSAARVERSESGRNANSSVPQTLSAEELAELSARAEEPGPEVVGGALSNLHLTYVVIALGAAVLVLILK